jgi:hypothetical protein
MAHAKLPNSIEARLTRMGWYQMGEGMYRYRNDVLKLRTSRVCANGSTWHKLQNYDGDNLLTKKSLTEIVDYIEITYGTAGIA